MPCKTVAAPELPASKGVGGRPDVTMAPKIDQEAPKWRTTISTRTPFGPTRETLKHGETPSGLDLRFVNVLRWLPFGSLLAPF